MHTRSIEPTATGAPWLARALVVSAVVHVIGVIAMEWTVRPARQAEIEAVDIEMAPAPPKAEALPAEVAKPPSEPEAKEGQAVPASAGSEPANQEPTVIVDAGVDARMDAAVDARARPDAKLDAAIDASIDAAVPMVAEVADAGGDVAMIGLGSGISDAAELASGSGNAIADASVLVASATGSGSGSESESESGSGSGIPAAIALGSGSGAAGMTTEPAVDGEPTTAGTAANLLAYFPPGHVLTALIRFDRLRGSEWAVRTERLLQPLPDYHALFGERDVRLAETFDTLVISTPRPKDATATTLVVRSAMSRSQVRDYLSNPQTPITWTVAKGGMLGRRGGKLFKGDIRVVLSPWQHWFVLAQPSDLGALTAPGNGKIDAVTAPARLPPWLQAIRKIEDESGGEKRGPALVVTFAGDGKPYTFPDVGLGITSLPAPERVSLAMELVKQGWLVRGNIKFSKPADATGFVQAVRDAQERIDDSHALSLVLSRQHALHMITGLSLAQTGARVSYATSISIADARALLSAAAATLDDYFAQAP